jgi:hypothetical protein
MNEMANEPETTTETPKNATPPQVPWPKQPEESVPLYSGIARLMRSSTAWVALAAIIGIIVLNVLGRIESGKALDAVVTIVLAYIAKVAVEDGAEKLRLVRRGGVPPAVAQSLLPLLMEALQHLGRLTKGDTTPISIQMSEKDVASVMREGQTEEEKK